MQTKKTLEDMQTMARAKGGDCLSADYINAHTPLQWKCAANHIWLAAPTNIQSGQWCPRCSRNAVRARAVKESLANMKQLAKAKGGECLSSAYIGAHANLQWKCAANHIWLAAPTNIQSGQWCPHCAGNAKQTIEDMHKLAKMRSGECLSTVYVNARTNLQWQCSAGHIWKATPDSIQRGSWCSTCSAGNSERISRDIFEQLLKHPFPKAKPLWLRNDRGHRMELDGYSEELNLAFEYHGLQHYTPVAMFHRGGNTLLRRQADDQQKHVLCRAHGVTLVDIPYTVPLDEVPEYVARALHDRGLSYSMCDPETVTVAEHVILEKLREMQELATAKGGVCLSIKYVNSITDLMWQCAEGHTWKAPSSRIQQNGWCPTCAGKIKQTMADMHKLAKARGGACLSTEYINTDTNLQWQCAAGHTWKAPPRRIQQNGWCPECGKGKGGLRKKTIADMHALASEHGGKCVSTEYINMHTALQWQCSEGHTWGARPGNIRSGGWCPACANKQRWETRYRNAIAGMHALASKRGGKCVSTEYMGEKTTLQWQCSEGHTWGAKPANIQRGNWCPTCANKQRWETRRNKF